MDFKLLPLKLLDNDSNFYFVDSIELWQNNQLIRTESIATILTIDTFYTLLDDSNLAIFKNQSKPVEIKIFKNNAVIKTHFTSISGDCCHLTNSGGASVLFIP